MSITETTSNHLSSRDNNPVITSSELKSSPNCHLMTWQFEEVKEEITSTYAISFKGKQFQWRNKVKNILPACNVNSFYAIYNRGKQPLLMNVEKNNSAAYFITALSAVLHKGKKNKSRQTIKFIQVICLRISNA